MEREHQSKTGELADRWSAGHSRAPDRGTAPMLTPFRGVLFGLGLVVAGFLAFWGYGKYQSAHNAEVQAWKLKVHDAEVARDSALLVAARTDTLYKQGETVYLRGRNILLNPGPGKPPATPEVKACFALADSSRALCQRRHDADTAALHATERELQVWKDKPSDVRRIQAFGEALYDFNQRVPVIRLGATAKMIGPVHLSVAGEYAAPPAGKSDPAFRALIGARINF